VSDRVAYLNGEWVKESEATVSIHDRGFLLADAAYEVARTFLHQPFRLERHMARLYNTLRYLAIDPGMDAAAMQDLALEVLERNLPLLGKDGEYRIIFRVTRGLNPASYPVVRTWNEPTILICTTPIAFASFAARYHTGVPVITPSVRRTPPQCLDPRAKTHERLNLVMGQLEVLQVDPHAIPLLLDLQGNVTESAAANVFFVCGGELWTPSAQMVLGGITRETVIELACNLGIPIQEREINLFDAYSAQEAFLTSTSYSIMPVSQINGRPPGNVIPGPVTQALTQAFGDLVGVDIVERASRHLRS
jgi:branched-chain amino acid aminotransferase